MANICLCCKKWIDDYLSTYLNSTDTHMSATRHNEVKKNFVSGFSPPSFSSRPPEGKRRDS